MRPQGHSQTQNPSHISSCCLANALLRMTSASGLHLRLGRRSGGQLRDARLRVGIGRWRQSPAPALRQHRSLVAHLSRCVPPLSEAHGPLGGVCHSWAVLGRSWYSFREQLNSVETLWLKYDHIATFLLACALVAAFLGRHRE